MTSTDKTNPTDFAHDRPRPPADLADLLERPLHAAVGTVRPDGAPQVNPMWFLFDGQHILLSHTTKRAKYRNLQLNPLMSLLVLDPNDTWRYLEVRGRLERVDPDPAGAFYVQLGRRYGHPDQAPPADAADRVVLVMTLERFVRR